MISATALAVGIYLSELFFFVADIKIELFLCDSFDGDFFVESIVIPKVLLDFVRIKKQGDSVSFILYILLLCAKLRHYSIKANRHPRYPAMCGGVPRQPVPWHGG